MEKSKVKEDLISRLEKYLEENQEEVSESIRKNASTFLVYGSQKLSDEFKKEEK